jgi:mycofactocin glycosyltransferase
MTQPRPSADVVVPFRGSLLELRAVCERLSALPLRPGDSLIVVDNTPHREHAADGGPVRVLSASERQTPAFARNRGAYTGGGEWLVFIDADTVPDPDLLDRYFEPEPGSDTALLAGGVRDEFVPRTGRPVGRYAYIRAATSQDDTFRFGEWGFPKTANLAVRRSAFESVGGFRPELRSAEDSDLTFRLRAAGWAVERREDASVVHRSRQSLRAFVFQKATHGAGGAWIDRHYPGASPPRRRLGLIWWGLRTMVAGLAAAARTRDRDRALWALFEPIEAVAYEFGRSLPNERPLTPGVWWRALTRLRRSG